MRKERIRLDLLLYNKDTFEDTSKIRVYIGRITWTKS